MKRYISLILATLAAAMLLPSCGGLSLDPTPVPTPGPTPAESSTIVVGYSVKTVTVPSLLGSGASATIDFGDGSPVKAWNTGLSWKYSDGKASHNVTISATRTTGIQFGNLTGVTMLDVSKF